MLISENLRNSEKKVKSKWFLLHHLKVAFWRHILWVIFSIPPYLHLTTNNPMSLPFKSGSKAIVFFGYLAALKPYDFILPSDFAFSL